MPLSERGVWVVTPSGLVPKHLYHRPVPTRSDLPAPMIISDSLDGVWNPADGKTYDSKRAYYDAVKAKGCEIVGNEKPQSYLGQREEMPDPIHDIKCALDTIKSRPAKRKRRKAA